MTNERGATDRRQHEMHETGLKLRWRPDRRALLRGGAGTAAGMAALG
nr:hypothetical protein [Chloroflexia bacterium]